LCNLVTWSFRGIFFTTNTPLLQESPRLVKLLETMKIIQTEKMPQASGHYSQCIEHNGMLYISGQLPGNPEMMPLPEDIESQTKIVLDKIDLILNQAGSSREKVIQMRIYISDIELWNRVNSVYTRFYGEHKPVRCIVPTGRLHFGCLIEAEAVAYT